MPDDAYPAPPGAIRAPATIVYFDGRALPHDRPPPESSFAYHRSIERELAMLMAELERALRSAREAIRDHRVNTPEIELDELWAVRPMLARQVLLHKSLDRQVLLHKSLDRQVLLHKSLVGIDSKVASLERRLKNGAQTIAAPLAAVGPDVNGPDFVA
jgi:hypothetical protein